MSVLVTETTSQVKSYRDLRNIYEIHMNIKEVIYLIINHTNLLPNDNNISKNKIKIYKIYQKIL